MNTTTAVPQDLTEEQYKAIALLQHEGTDYTIVDGVITDEDGNEYNTPEDVNSNYIVLTDEEADERAAEYIKNSLWAFNADFIIQHSKLPYEAKDMIQAYQEKECESANETIEALIEDMDEFISDAISADGRGHFMSSYDGHEHEVKVNGVYYYIYREN